MDIVLRKKTTGQILAVLDTKYKRAAQLDPADVSQVHTYAAQTHAPTAILVYPSSPKKPLDGHIDDISLQSLVFDISKEDIGGHTFLSKLMEIVV